MFKDHLGEEIKLGDWCAMTQNNSIYVGKIIKLSAKGNPTVARDSVEEFMATNKTFKAADWTTQRQMIQSRFPSTTRSRWGAPDWCRDKKFVRINPTNKMLKEYDFKPATTTP